ncbi:hypothetical protein JTB14_034456 [Gonioctena quinquepunctata]|nr:hypothetical protein JTB14_034456 [Gonioctena quinquepunctata]
MQQARHNRNFILAGDFNAKSTLWNAGFTEARAEYPVEWMNTPNMVSHNEGYTPTFARGNQMSFIDLTLSSRGMATKVYESLQRRGDEPRQDHTPPHQHKHGKNVKLTEGNIENPEQLISVVKNAQQLGIDEVAKDINHPTWWNEEIATFQADCNRSRRRLIRARSRLALLESIEQLEIEYNNNRKELRRSIKISQKEQWKLLCNRLDEDPRSGYKIVVGELKHARTAYTLNQG